MYIRKDAPYSVKYVLDRFIIPNNNNKDKALVEFNEDMISMDSHRYWNFKENGCACVECGLEGTYFRKEKAGENDERYHFNLYAINSFGRERMITKDHIIPKSKGGRDHVDNYQPMCTDCNSIKCSLEGEELKEIFDYSRKLNSYNYDGLKFEYDKFREELKLGDNEKASNHLRVAIAKLKNYGFKPPKKRSRKKRKNISRRRLQTT